MIEENSTYLVPSAKRICTLVCGKSGSTANLVAPAPPPLVLALSLGPAIGESNDPGI